MGGRKWTASIRVFEKTESFPERIKASAKYSPFRSCYTHVRGFGKCDSITNLEEVDLSETLRKIERHTPNSCCYESFVDSEV